MPSTKAYEKRKKGVCPQDFCKIVKKWPPFASDKGWDIGMGGENSSNLSINNLKYMALS